MDKYYEYTDEEIIKLLTEEDKYSYDYDYEIKYWDYYNNIMNDNSYNEDEKTDILNEIYQNDLLRVFNNLEEYNEKIIDKIQTNIFTDLVKNEKMQDIMKILAGRFLTENLEIGFAIMFSYDYFYILHKIIVSYYKNGEIDIIFLDELENKAICNNNIKNK